MALELCKVRVEGFRGLRCLEVELSSLTVLLGESRSNVGDVVRAAYLQLEAPGEPQIDPWEVLGLRPGATQEQIEAMYKVLAFAAHPDHGGSNEAMKKLTRAKELALEAVS